MKITGKDSNSDYKLHPIILKETLATQSHHNIFTISSFQTKVIVISKIQTNKKPHKTEKSNPYSGEKKKAMDTDFEYLRCWS